MPRIFPLRIRQERQDVVEVSRQPSIIESVINARSFGSANQSAHYPLIWKIGLDRATCCLWWACFEVVSFAAVLMARSPPQMTSAEPSETSHFTKLTNDIGASRFKKPALWNINAIKIRYACIAGGRSYGVFWLASFVTIAAPWLALDTKGMECFSRFSRRSLGRGAKETSFEANWRPSWKDDPKLGVCRQIILRDFRNMFRMQPLCSLRQRST